MVSPRWRKVLRDLFSNKTRTLLVVLSIAVGVFAVGMIASSRVIMLRDMSNSIASVNLASATINSNSFDEELVQVVRNMPGVREAEGHSSIGVRLKVGDQWRSLVLNAVHDYDDMRINKITPVSGAWPPREHELLIERASLSFTGAQVGDTVLIQQPNGKQRQMRIAGVVHDVNLPSSKLAPMGFGFINRDTLAWLGASRDFDEMRIVVDGKPTDMAHIQQIADQVRDKIEKSGRTVHYVQVPEPGKHWAESVMQPLLLILGVLGVMSLLLSGFLVVNTISALLTQQVRQIGVMKAIGARSSQIVGMYLTTVVMFSLLSLLVAVPLGALGARLFTGFLADLLNFNITSYGIPWQVFLLEAAVGLIVPLLAALWPVIAGARITVREAISGYGLGKGHFGKGIIDRLLERVRGVSRPMLLSLRNTFRRKGRLMLTLTTLTLAGMIFITVFTVRSSLLLTLDDALNYWKYDVQAGFSRGYRLEQLEQEAMRVPGVVAAESWTAQSTRLVRADKSESDTIFTFGLPANTQMVQPTLVEGRWLLPNDQNAIVVNTEVLKSEENLKVGDTIVLKIKGRETSWQIVGVVRGVLTGPIMYTNYPYFAQVTRDTRSSQIQIITEQHDGAYQDQVAKALEAHFKSIGMKFNSAETTTSIRSGVEFQFNIIIGLLLVMAVLLAVVGGLGLMGTMSINVLERTREIGVMRAIGATNGAIRQIVMVEGILIGGLSWLVGTAIAIPVSKPLSDAVGIGLLQAPLSYTFSTGGALIWLAVVLVLAALASVLPAWNASRLTVREVLAYE